MADNLNIDSGNTLTVATDFVGGIHYQRVKIAHGDDGTANDAGPTAPFPVVILAATLGTVTVSPTSTKVTVDNTVNATLTSTKVTVEATTPVPVSGTVSLSSTKVTVDNTVTASLSNTKVTVEASVAIPVSGTVSLSSTKVTVESSTPVPVSLSSTKVTVDNTVNVSLNSTSVTVNVGRTLTGSSGSFAATNATLFTPTNKAKVYAFSLTTTSASELICVFHSGGLELWRDTLMAPSGSSAGANLAVSPPSFLFQSRTGTAVSLSLSSAVLIHWSISCFDEA